MRKPPVVGTAVTAPEQARHPDNQFTEYGLRRAVTGQRDSSGETVFPPSGKHGGRFQATGVSRCSSNSPLLHRLPPCCCVSVCVCWASPRRLSVPTSGFCASAGPCDPPTRVHLLTLAYHVYAAFLGAAPAQEWLLCCLSQREGRPTSLPAPALHLLAPPPARQLAARAADLPPAAMSAPSLPTPADPPPLPPAPRCCCRTSWIPL